jgi:hypothetical protein
MRHEKYKIADKKSPLHLGEGGVREAIHQIAKPEHFFPHPNLLPEGEGTCTN